MARWMNTDATNGVACPQCKQPAGSPCQTPKGRKCNEPHGRRLWAFQHTPGFDMSNYTIKISSVDQIVAGGKP